MNRVRMLVHFGITPYLVFDGDYLPSKASTEKDRAGRRKESRTLGLQYLKAGKAAQAQQELQKAVDVTPEMAGLLIAELKKANVQYVVAPYEADSQLAYLENKGVIQAILSEDSDLLVFGARCLLTKLDQYGECVMIRRDDFTACREISLVGWTDADFRRMAILSGCDYLASVANMGLKTAYRLLRKHKTVERTIRAIQFDGKFRVPQGYLENFIQAEMTFLYQWVFCPAAKAMVHLTKPEDGVDPSKFSYIGASVEASVAQGVADGRLNPHTKEALILPVVARNGRPSLPLTRAKTTPAPSDLKKNHSIDSFFRPKRTPLGELDPNMFAASPSQQQTLQQAIGTSWPATPSPVGTPILSNTRPTGRLFPNTVRRSLSNPMAQTPLSQGKSIQQSMTAPARTSTSIDVRSAKRPRLCASGSSPASNRVRNAAEERSKFFASPSRPPKARAELWSDDSLEDALLHLPEPGNFGPSTQKGKAIAIFTDNMAPTPNPELPPAGECDTSQSTAATIGSSFGERGGDEDESPPSSIERDAATPKTSRRTGLARFAYGTESKAEQTCIPNSPDQVSHLARKDTTEYVLETEVLEAVVEKSSIAASDRAQLGDSSLAASQSLPSSTAALQGSEDLLISDSEVEEDEVKTKSCTLFDVSRFTFLPA